MTNKRTTKPSLVASIVLLFMCFSMLLGTTFAWFTDSATSAGNKIVAGTLDVDLLMWDGDSYEDIGDSNAPIFGKGSLAQNNNAETLWEPGKTQVVYLKIVNNGTLDLKYSVAINVRDNADDKDLYKALEYAITPDVKDGTGVSAWTTGKKVNVGNNLATDSAVTLEAKEDGKVNEHFFAHSVHMLEEAGNEYQGGYVEFDIKVAATQVNTEEDSFGPDYDVDATLPDVAVVNVPAGTTEATSVKVANTTVKVPAGAAAGTYKLSVSNEKVVTDAEGNTVASFDIELTRNGEKVPAGAYVVERYVGEYLNDVKVTHKGEPVAIDDYDPATGYVTFTVDSFSPFAVSYYRGIIDSVDDLVNISKGGSFVLGADITIADTIVIPEGISVVLDLNGKTITATDKNVVRNDGANVIVNNGTIKRDGTAAGYAFNNAVGAFEINNVNIYGGLYTSGNALSVNKSTINQPYESRHAIYSYNCETVINSGKIHNDNAGNAAIMAAGSSVVTINGGEFSISNGQATHGWTSCLLDSQNTAAIVINDGIFNGGFRTQSGSSLTINGGSFNDVYGSGYNVYTGATVTVKGGVFTDANSINYAKKYVADGYKAVNNNGMYTVLKGDTVVTNSEELHAAIQAGQTNIALADGNYVMPDGWTDAHDTYNQAGYDDGYTGINLQNKTLTLIGSRNVVIDAKGIDSRDQFVTGANLTFDGVTVNFGTNNYMGFMNTASLIYKDCAINGLQFFGESGEVAFVDCDLNSNGAEHSVWTWSGDKTISFTGCDFTYADRAVNCYGEGGTTNISFTDCTFTKVAGKETTGAIETNSAALTALNLTINNCTVNEGELWFIAGWDSLSGAKTTATVNGSADKGVVLVQSSVLPYLTLNSNATYVLTGDFGGQNVSLVMPVGVENVIFDGSKATNINELIITQNGALIDNANTPIGERSGNVTIQNFNVLSQINVFACKTEVVVQKNTAEALMIYAGNCDVKVLNNTIDANFESHPTYRNATQTWNTNNYGIALNIFDYNLWLDGNTVTDATGHAIGINGWETTIDNGDANVIESFKGNIITVNSTSHTKRADLKVCDDETYASNDADTNVVNATAQAFINAVLADGSNTFNIVDGYDHTIFSFYNVNTNN